MAWKPTLSDLLVINRPYNWLEGRFVRDKDAFYAPQRRKYGHIAGVSLYAAFALCGAKMYQNLNDDWQYADLSPTYTLARYTMTDAAEPEAGILLEKSNAKIKWGAAALFNFWAGDFAFMYAARNRRHNKERGEKSQKTSDFNALPR